MFRILLGDIIQLSLKELARYKSRKNGAQKAEIISTSYY